MATNDKLTDLRIVWDALDPLDTARSGHLVALEHFSWGSLNAGVDSQQRTHTLNLSFLGVLPSAFKKLPSGRGYICRQILSEDGLIQRFSVVRQSDADEGIFLIFCSDLWSSFHTPSHQPMHPDEALKTVLARLDAWQEFMRRQQPGGLTLDEECGLIGELSVLAKLVEEGCPVDTALDAWRGPFRDIHDFDSDGDTIEVKTSRGNSYGSYTVDNEHQLDHTAVRRLQLAAIDLRSDADGRTLVEWIEFVRRLLPPRLGEIFCERLYRAGINPTSPMCSEESWAIERMRFFLVDDDFPAITPRTLPTTVSKVRYTLKPMTTEKMFVSPLPFNN